MELKKCPFCNGIAEIQSRYGNTYYKGSDFVYVRCSRCYSQGKTITINDNDIEKAEMLAAEAWNIRP